MNKAFMGNTASLSSLVIAGVGFELVAALVVEGRLGGDKLMRMLAGSFSHKLPVYQTRGPCVKMSVRA